MAKKITMRDSFFNELYKIAKKDRDVIIVDADMGAPALDKYRRDLKEQFINVGIAEANMITIAAGLAKNNKKPFTYCIAPFATSRCHEFVKVEGGIMNLPINIVGIGAGFSYDDSGPTHHTTEDISIMRVIPNLEILSPCDSISAGAFAEIAYKSNNPTYIRLDRDVLPNIYENSEFFEQGFKEIKKGKDIGIVSTGNMVHRALEVNEKFLKEGKEIGVIDLYKLKPTKQDFVKNVLEKYKQIISLEEHLLAGGLGSIISELIVDNNLPTKLKRIGLNDKYYYLYGRENIHKKVGLDVKSISQTIENLV